MSKVKITGHASGSGTLTITGPDTSSDRTLTLPDATGTLAITTDDDDKLPLAGGTMTGDLVVGAITDAATNSIIINSSDGSYFHTKTENDDEVGAVMFGNDSADLDGRIQYDSRRMRFFTAGSERLNLTAAGLGLSQFTAKAWCMHDPTPDIQDSHNISSVTDSGTGNFRVNFDVDLANANYAGVGTASTKSGSHNDTVAVSYEAYNTAAIGAWLYYRTSNTTQTDPDRMHSVYFGD